MPRFECQTAVTLGSTKVIIIGAFVEMQMVFLLSRYPGPVFSQAAKTGSQPAIYWKKGRRIHSGPSFGIRYPVPGVRIFLINYLRLRVYWYRVLGILR